MAQLSSSIKDMEQYIKLKPIHDKYRAAKNKEAFYMKYESELRLFEEGQKVS